MKYPTLILMILLSACNTVITKAPLFAKADAIEPSPLKSGVWRAEAKDDCKVDEAKPLADWPECANGVVFGGGQAGYFNRASGAPIWTQEPLILVTGDPMVGQARLNISGDVKVDGATYAYAGIEATKTDKDGKVTALAFWPVQCGPPPPGGDGATTAPLAGMVMKSGDMVCTTTSKDALYRAAKRSKAWTIKSMAVHWVRGGEK